MFNPLATYRLQFHKEFNFDDFETVIPYLKELGIGTVYASPVFRAVPGSNHGYDGTHPHEINEEIGTLEQLTTLSRELKNSGIGWLQDIVPNHMAFHPENEWLTDVLEKGRQSAYYAFFDIIRDHPDEEKLLVPFLGDSPDQVIGRGELKIAWTDRLVLQYFDQRFPLNRRSYARVLRACPDSPDQAVLQLLEELERLHRVEDPAVYGREWREFLLQLDGLMKHPESGLWVRNCILQVNSNPALLTQVAGEQEYRLCHWSETDRKINYRRFFTVNSLMCLDMQDPGVFAQYHRLIRDLVKQGVFDGLRVDHVDGLGDPSGYLEQLRDLAGDDAYITVEKILEPGEKLPREWPVEGNTGYDFLGLVNNLLTDSSSEPAFTAFYDRLAGPQRPVGEQIAEKKRKILFENMAGDLANLVRLFPGPEKPDAGDLEAAIAEFLVRFPVYRYYGNRIPLDGAEKTAVQEVLDGMRTAGVPATGYLERVILADGADPADAQGVLRFYQRLMQFTGPLMAKGVEDTLMYTYNRFIGHNEVGDSPETFGLSTSEFHRLMRQRLSDCPLSMNATSTHDTKRGEDARARLAVLTDLADEWFRLVEHWQQVNAELKTGGGPDANDEYFIYQSLLGGCPMPGQSDAGFPERIREYLVKALREGKVRSGWTIPDKAYEKAAGDFAVALLDNPAFLADFRPFHEKVSGFGIVNSLVQLVLKFTCPGVPDVYQGTEHWDLSFVDPDNRRPVDFVRRLSWLQELKSPDPANLWRNRYDGRIKVWLTAALFRLRRSHQELFTAGDYLPLITEGKFKDHVCCFARRYRDEWLTVIVPLHLARILDDPAGSPDWDDTRVLMPAGAPGSWQDVLTGRSGIRELRLQGLLQDLPVLILRPEAPRSRNAGILLSVTSLPSAFAIGDMGPEAYAFADYLDRSRQRYWQLLPLNPTDPGQMHSPYSSVSAMAGNTLLISPEGLADFGLLTADDCRAFRQEPDGTVDYDTAARVRNALFDLAWKRFSSGRYPGLRRAYRQFQAAEKDWLEDYALFIVLQDQFGREPWYAWPPEFRLREKQALQAFAAEHGGELEKIRFLQFIFQFQWSALKKYCNRKGIDLLGDLPFYVSHHSADVWANRDLFRLDDEGAMTGIAGVPPDYFNADGQLWGMPVFRWDVLREQEYSWWIRRIRRNLELYDLIRLDHFRAFSAYWEVPPDSGTARHGSWKPGPGHEFFRVVERELGSLPFLAEDLGDIDEPVYRLRDAFGLPGMKVLQFAFGEDLPRSLNAPHNYSTNFFVYTGTHDNNTTVGWFRTEAGEAGIRNIGAYTGIVPTGQNIHRVLARTAYASVARTVIIPMQDVLGLDGSARMNTPAATSGNWFWRLRKEQAGGPGEADLREWAALFNR